LGGVLPRTLVLVRLDFQDSQLLRVVNVQLSVTTQYGGKFGGRCIRRGFFVAQHCQLALLTLMNSPHSRELDCLAASKANGLVAVSNYASHCFLDAPVRASRSEHGGHLEMIPTASSSKRRNNALWQQISEDGSSRLMLEYISCARCDCVVDRSAAYRYLQVIHQTSTDRL
jgi:hypothetical protein